jgi:hypothetical protein
MKPPSILLEAEALVNGERQSAYGPVKVDFGRTAGIFNAIVEHEAMDAVSGVLFMIAVKLSREMHKHKRDNLVDLCGYAELLNQLLEGGE